jgi:hypothetical protein
MDDVVRRKEENVEEGIKRLYIGMSVARYRGSELGEFVF